VGHFLWTPYRLSSLRIQQTSHIYCLRVMSPSKAQYCQLASTSVTTIHWSSSAAITDRPMGPAIFEFYLHYPNGIFDLKNQLMMMMMMMMMTKSMAYRRCHRHRSPSPSKCYGHWTHFWSIWLWLFPPRHSKRLPSGSIKRWTMTVNAAWKQTAVLLGLIWWRQ